MNDLFHWTTAQDVRAGWLITCQIGRAMKPKSLMTENRTAIIDEVFADKSTPLLSLNHETAAASELTSTHSLRWSDSLRHRAGCRIRDHQALKRVWLLTASAAGGVRSGGNTNQALLRQFTAPS